MKWAGPRYSTGVDGEKQINKHELVSHAAAKTSVTRADAGPAVNAVLAAIADAFARGETVTLAGVGTLSTTAHSAREGRNPRTAERIAIEVSSTPAFKAGKTFCHAVNGQAAGQSDPAHPRFQRPPIRRMPAIVSDARSSAPPATRASSDRLRQSRRRTRRSFLPFSPKALHGTDHCSAADLHSPYRGTNVAGRKRGDFWDSSHVRTHAQSRAEIESPRARGPKCGRMRNSSCDTAAHRGAPVEVRTLPRRLRCRRIHSIHPPLAS